MGTGWSRYRQKQSSNTMARVGNRTLSGPFVLEIPCRSRSRPPLRVLSSKTETVYGILERLVARTPRLDSLEGDHDSDPCGD